MTTAVSIKAIDYFEDLWLGCCQQMACIFPTSEPKSCQSTLKKTIIILLVHTTILQYVHLMPIDGCDGVIWPIWYYVLLV
jgi:hypothetical protein